MTMVRPVFHVKHAAAERAVAKDHRIFDLRTCIA